MDPSKPGYRE